MLHVCILCASRWVPRWAGKEQNAAGGHGSHTPRHSEHVMTKKNTMKFSSTHKSGYPARDDDVCHSARWCAHRVLLKGPQDRPHTGPSIFPSWTTSNYISNHNTYFAMAEHLSSCTSKMQAETSPISVSGSSLLANWVKSYSCFLCCI